MFSSEICRVDRVAEKLLVYRSQGGGKRWKKKHPKCYFHRTNFWLMKVFWSFGRRKLREFDYTISRTCWLHMSRLPVATLGALLTIAVRINCGFSAPLPLPRHPHSWVNWQQMKKPHNFHRISAPSLASFSAWKELKNPPASDWDKKGFCVLWKSLEAQWMMCESLARTLKREQEELN